MKMVFVLTCCLALASVTRGADPQNSPPPKKGAGHSQASQHGAGGPVYSGGTGPGKHAVGPGHVVGPGHAVGAGQKLQTQHSAYTGGTRTTSRTGTSSQTFRAQHFNLSTKTKPTSAGPAVTYRTGSRIQGSQTWQGSSYSAFRSYSPQWHNRNWWGSHHNRIVFVFGSPYYWDSGYWYPAWGYDPYASYYYDGPIYAYNDLPPDQVIANVQAALQAQGYYQGEVDGVLGPLTRAAIANYQRDQGLYITSAIDEPTLASLGMV
jgi:hypothetical protein